MSTPAASTKPVLLPTTGTARVKNVMSGDTVILWGKAAAPHLPPPQVQFTLDGLLSPRLSSKNYPTDDPGAFPAREFLRSMLVGKMVTFETTRRKPVGGASNGKEPTQYYHYGHLIFEGENVGLRIVKNGHAKVRDDFKSPSADDNGDKVNNGADISEQEKMYRKQFAQAYQEAIAAGVGLHSKTVAPLVRNPKNVDDTQAMVKKLKKVTGVIEYVFDGSRFRCQITKSPDPAYEFSTFTLALGGVVCPRSQRPSQALANPPPQVAPNTTPEQELQMGAQARIFAEQRMLQRELEIVLHGTDKSGGAAVATINHPKGNIAVELLKNGLAKMADWSVRMMDPSAVPPMRAAENAAKKSKMGIWQNYEAPKLTGAAQIIGTCIDIVSGDTIVVLPQGKIYDSEDALQKVSLASIRSPRLGNERSGRADEPYAFECKEKLRALVAGKQVNVQIHYEREIPLAPEKKETRRFGTVAVGKKADVGEVLVSEGLAVTQRHRDDDEKSPRYDDLRQAEAIAAAGKKGSHKGGEYKRNATLDLTDPRKAMGYQSSLERSGSIKAVVEFCFNGSRFKMYIPSENAYIMFAPNNIRCPQPSPNANAARQGKKAEPFGDASKRHARMTVLQRAVDITCTSCTKGGVITGSMHVGQGPLRRDYGLELVMAGLATVDQRKIDWGEAPKQYVDAQNKARAGKIGLWSVERVVTETEEKKPAEKAQAKTVKVRLSEIRAGNHFFFQNAEDDSAAAMDKQMKTFTEANGTDGAECEMKVNTVVAALFDDGSGKSWYRAKLTERANGGKVKVLFIDHGNLATVPVATHLRPLSEELGTDKIPPVAKEAVLCNIVTRSLNTDEGHDAASMLQDVAWGKDLSCAMFGPDDDNRLAVTLQDPSGSNTINEELVAAGLARVVKKPASDALARRMADGSAVYDLYGILSKAQNRARTTRSGMWRYGDVGDDDDHDGY